MKKIILLLFVVFPIFCCCDNDKVNNDAEIFQLNSIKDISLVIGERITILHDLDGVMVDFSNSGIVTYNGLNELLAISAGETYATVTHKGESKVIKIKVENRYTLDTYYNKFTYSYIVKDTTGLTVKSSPINSDDPNVIYITGLRDNKLWIATFDTNTRKQILEIQDNEIFDPFVKIDIGYGEYKNYQIDIITPDKIIETENGWIVRASVSDINEKHSQYCFLFFIGDGYSKKIECTYNSSYFSEWYDKSFLDVSPRDGYFCFDQDGVIIWSGLRSRDYGSWSNSIPISYEEFICFRISSFFNSETGFYEEVIELSKDQFQDKNAENEENRVNLFSVDDNKAKYTAKLVSRLDKILTINIDVTEYSGRKHSHIVELNLSTFDVEVK